MTSLLNMVTFDPLPDGCLKTYFGFNPQWTDKSPSLYVVERLNITDRAFLNVLGSVFIVIVLFIVSQVLVFILSFCTSINFLKKIHNFFKLSGTSRQIFLMFYVVLFLDILIGGLINTENDYLMVVPSNWGPNGNLNLSD